jgi:Zn finger protein HypA/HybF involved in hydrogenase expression
MSEPDEEESFTETIGTTGATFIVSSEPLGDIWCDCGARMIFVCNHMLGNPPTYVYRCPQCGTKPTARATGINPLTV